MNRETLITCEVVARHFELLSVQEHDANTSVIYRSYERAIRSLIAHATEMQAVMEPKARPDKPGDYVVGFANSPVRRVVTVSVNLLVADSDYPVGRTVEEYGAAWYLGPMEMPR